MRTATERAATMSKRAAAVAAPAEVGLYLYGVIGLEGSREPPRAAGLEPDEPVSFLVRGPLAAVVSRVPLAEFEPDAVRVRLGAGGVGWVEERALAHAAVLQELLRRGPVVPARFGTCFQSPDHVFSVLGAREGELMALLQALRGKVEWGVRVFCQTETAKETLALEDAEIRRLQERTEALGPGEAYLQRRRLDVRLEEIFQARLVGCVAAFHGALAGAAEAATELESTGHGRVGPGELLALHGAYLVREERTVAFHRELERLQGEGERLGLRFDLTGPWPPYHFVGPPPSRESA